MHEEPNILGAFKDRVKRLSRDALTQYRVELKAIAQALAARGLHSSGARLRQRVTALGKWTQILTDQVFEGLTRLPGDQRMHRLVFAEFLSEQLHNFFLYAEADVFFQNFGPAAMNETRRLISEVRDNLEADIRDFQAGLWHPRTLEKGASVTNNTLNIHSSNVGSVQQAGADANQSASVHFNVEAVQTALEDFVASFQSAKLPDETTNAAMIEVETIRPQLRKASPNAAIVREGLHSLRNILEGVAAGVLATKIMLVLAAAGLS